MIWVLLSIFSVGILFAVLGFSNKKWKLRKRQWIAVVGVVWMAGSMIATVPTGHTGILTTFGRVENTTLEAGIHVKSPFQKVVCMDNRTQKALLEMMCFSSDIQEVTVNYSINYQIEKVNAQNIYKSIGTDYYKVVMEPRIQEAVKSVIAKYTAENLIANRDLLSRQITEILTDTLGTYNIEVVNTSIEELDFSDVFTNAVEEKQVAQQAKLKAETEQEQKVMEERAAAEREVIAAEAKASIAEIQAKADAEVIKIQAEAAEYAGKKDAAVNDAIAASLTEDLLKYYEIKQWDGKLPEQVVSGTGAVLPILGNPEASAGTTP